MVSRRNDWIIIGISGVTCGGKTSLAHQLASTLAPVHVFHQDKYFFPDDSARHVRCASLPHNNYDILSALDMDAMLRDVTRTLAGDDRAHATTTDVTGRYTRPGKKFLIAEGFTVLNYPPIMEMCDLRYYFVLELGECRARRALRLYEPPDIEGYFELCVWPEHLNYKAEIEKDKRVKILDGTRADAFDIVMADIKALNT
nr:nicotinamide riboside kinase 1 [Helicoverpa armigera]